MVELIKINNKLVGYKCDNTQMVGKVMYTDNKKWYCKEQAIKEFGQEAVDKAVLEE